MQIREARKINSPFFICDAERMSTMNVFHKFKSNIWLMSRLKNLKVIKAYDAVWTV